MYIFYSIENRCQLEKVNILLCFISLSFNLIELVYLNLYMTKKINKCSVFG